MVSVFQTNLASYLLRVFFRAGFLGIQTLAGTTFLASKRNDRGGPKHSGVVIGLDAPTGTRLPRRRKCCPLLYRLD